ncbi:MAG: hypothetical protein ABR588_10645 [Sphingomicrobium sp.]|nr:hypothetical protein [Sphingomonadales bacterium]
MLAPDPAPVIKRPWWETRGFVAALILAAMLPLLYPPVPPLVDLFGHIGRYRVELDLAHSPALQRYFTYHWLLMGNLGLDLLIVPMAKLFGLELGAKLLVLAIPPLTVAGFLWVAREVHHRLPPTALFALPFAFGHPFLFGFVNFSLSMALAFLAFGLWLRMARLGATRLRLVVFVPISLLLWLVHTYGWGLLGLLAFSAESVRQHDRGRSWFMAGVHGALHASVMALPLFLTLYWQSGAQQSLALDWFNFTTKWRWVKAALRDRWGWYDQGSLIVVALLFVGVIFLRRLTFSRNLFFSALVLIAVYLMLPRIIFGSAYADMRLVPFIFATILLSIRFKGDTHLPTARVLAIVGLAFSLVRLGGTTVSLTLASLDQSAKLTALDHVPIGARVLTMVGHRCRDDWALPRNAHLGAMVIVRRDGFSNDQWPMLDAKLLGVRDASRFGWFAYDPSEQVRPPSCADREHWAIGLSLARFPRDQFDYLWLIDPPAYNPRLVADLTPVWRGPRTILYRVHS